MIVTRLPTLHFSESVAVGLETVWKVRLGGKMVPYQVNETALRGLLCALHATEDLLSSALQRLSRQSLSWTLAILE